MTVARDGRVLDRRRVELVAPGLPSLPHHHDAQGLPEPEALALIDRVTKSAETCATAALEDLARCVPAITAIAIRACPSLPESIIERITDYRAQCVADTVMFRNALANAAHARGWAVHWYDARKVMAEAARAVGRPTIEDLLLQTGAALGRPWRKDHQIAMAAALAVG
jgi:hypothetical protein